MRRHAELRAGAKIGLTGLDAEPRADSLSRAVLTDLALDLKLLDNEAALVFAHMRAVIADLAGVKVDKGDAAS